MNILSQPDTSVNREAAAVYNVKMNSQSSSGGVSKLTVSAQACVNRHSNGPGR